MKKRLTIIVSVCLIILVSNIFASALSSGGRCFVDANKKCGDGKYTYVRLNGQSIALRMMYLKDTGETAYCIEFGNSLQGQLERNAQVPDGSAYWNALPAGAREGISLAALYGYPNNLLGVSADDAYAATQALIWEYQCGIRTSPENNTKSAVTYRGVNFSADKFSGMLSGTSGMTAYNNLLNLVSKHHITPEFGEMVLEFDKEAKMYVGTFEDRNGVLSDYAVSCDNRAVSFSKSGNTLSLSCKSCEPDFHLSFNRIMPASTQSMLILNAGSEGQECLIGAKPCPMGSTATVHVEPLVIPMHKIGVCKVDALYRQAILEELSHDDSEETPCLQPLAGCIVEIFAAEDIYTVDGILRYEQDELVDTITTESEGAVYSCELFEGKYYLMEAVAPEGYIRNDERIEIEVGEDDGYLIHLEVENERIPEPPPPPPEEPPIIVEEETPLAPSEPPPSPEVPNTLDENNLFSYAIAVAVAGIGCLLVRNRKQTT